jgi:hypothetical protein
MQARWKEREQLEHERREPGFLQKLQNGFLDSPPEGTPRARYLASCISSLGSTDFFPLLVIFLTDLLSLPIERPKK